MPTECERNTALLGAQNLDQNHHHHHDQEIRPQAREPATQQTTTTVMNDNLEIIEEGAGSMAVRSPSVDSMSQTSIASPTTETPTTNGLKGSTNGSGESKRTSLTSPDPTSYVTKARVTRPIPPPPSYNPMQFVQIKPCNLYQSAQEQLKKVEEVKKIKEIKKEEPEEWQNNLDNWKSSRRKRVEHIIDRVVEVKKLELEEHDRSRRKSKTFSEMIEERGERAGRTKLKSLAVYNEDEANDLSDLGIGTSSASGKSSLSEDYDNNSVTSDNPELDKAIQNENNHYQATSVQPREYIASPGYETSSSTAPASSPDPCEYTYEGAIQDYKQRISRAASATSSGNYKPPSGSSNNPNNHVNNSNGSYNNPGESDGTKLPPNTLNLSGGISNKNNGEIYSPRRGNKIEDRLLSFEVTSPSDHQEGVEKLKVDVPKIDILKRKEIFESQEKSQQNGVHGQSGNLSTSSSSNAIDVTGGAAPKVTLRDRFKYESNASSVDQSSKKDMRRLSGDVTSIRERLQSLEQQKDTTGERRTVDIPVPPLKDRLSSLQNAVKKEEIKKPPVVLVDARQLEIMKNEEETAKQRKLESTNLITYKKNDQVDDSGILSNGQEDVKLEEKRLQQKEQEDQLNAAIAALALEEKQLEEAANAVNKIEAEFEEIATPASTNNSDSKSTSNSNGNSNSNATTNQTSQLPYEMDFSVSATNNFLGAGGSCSSSGFDGDGSRESSHSNDTSNRSSLSQDTVIAVESNTPASVKLQRKPSNEMVHHRNLLKMFKETFKNDIELDEGIEESVQNIPTPTDSTIKAEQPQPQPERDHAASTSMIPIPRPNVCISKPPQSPKLGPRTPPTLTSNSPSPSRRFHQNDSGIESPVLQRKPATPFSINGRVEIFNSKTMMEKPPSPTLCRAFPQKKPFLAHLPSDKMKPVMNSPPDDHIECHQEPNAPIQAQSNANQASKPTVKAVSEAKPQPKQPQKQQHEIKQQEQKQQKQSQNQKKPQPQQRMASKITTDRPEVPAAEIVICAPPITILNPDELPKPNTVKALSSCFSQDSSSNGAGAGAGGAASGSKTKPPIPAPKPLPRTRIPQSTPPQSPVPTKRNLAFNADLDEAKTDEKKLSIASSTSTVSSSDLPKGHFETTAIVHSPPFGNQCPVKPMSPKAKPKYLPIQSARTDPLSPNDSLTPVIISPSEMPALVPCSPNESSLFKLASAPPSPKTPTTPVDQPTDEDVALCSSFLSQLIPKSSPQSLRKVEPVRQMTVEELPCEKLDIRKLPANDQVPRTAFQEISLNEIESCDGGKALSSKPPTSPIIAARAAHSRALIETCEKIIAEERAASNQLKSQALSSSSSPRATPISVRKSKIPKPIQCCIGSPTDSLPSKKMAPPPMPNDQNDDNMLVGRLHMVETQIKVTTTTPPASPKCESKSNKSPHEAQQQQQQGSKGVKNTIFDFIKKNFGHHEEVAVVETTTATPSSANVPHDTNADLHTIKKDEIRTVENSKFYLPSDDVTPPPLPKSPAPVNIEITRTITTDEILDETNSEQAFSQEINDLLDAELNKLSLESNSSQ